MAIPDFQSLMLPVLEFTATGEAPAIPSLAKHNPPRSADSARQAGRLRAVLELVLKRLRLETR
jgi:hypothetical protein